MVELLKLHLGCGKNPLKGYVNVGLADFPHIDVRADVRKLPFKDESATIIYASHLLEYFDRCCEIDGKVEAHEVLKEWKRVLVPGGIIRVAVPDFAALVQVYNKYKNLNPKNGVLGPIYGHWPIPGGMVCHKTIYDFDTLSQTLTKAGFIGIKYWDWKQVFVGENIGFDDQSKAYWPPFDENGIHVSLNLEAMK